MARRKRIKVSKETLLLHTIHETAKQFEKGSKDAVDMVFSLAEVVKNNNISTMALRKFKELIRKAKINALINNDEHLFNKLSTVERTVEIQFKRSL